MQENEKTDKELIACIQQDDREAFRILFRRHYKALVATASNITKDVNSGKDVTQDVFLKLWNKRASINVKGATIAYLKRAVINQSLNHIDSRKRIDDDSELQHESSKSTSIELTLEGKDLERAMKASLESMPEGCRKVFVLRRLEGLRVKEIAEHLGISPKTVENQLTKALKILKTDIQPYLNENTS